jgi:hypothetical protein
MRFPAGHDSTTRPWREIFSGRDEAREHRLQGGVGDGAHRVIEVAFERGWSDGLPAVPLTPPWAKWRVDR